MNHISAQILANAATRRTQFEGRDTLIAPVILLVEGVHAGSNGPLYYPSSVLRAYAQAWNGVPLPVHHPEQDGQPVSCNSPDVIQSRSVGRLWNVRFEESPKPRLKGEIWVDVAKCASVAPEVLEALKSNRPLEVSTGLFSTDEIGTGTWNTEDYHATVRDMRPDHLALLPGVTGACSWQDGCGVRANFNPNHDPENGQFTSGTGGSTAEAGSILSTDERFAIEVYKQEGWTINQALRDYKRGNITIGEGEYLTTINSKALDSAFDKGATSIDAPVVVYRGVKNMEIPQLFVDNGYISVTTDRQVAEMYAGKIGKVIEVALPKGMKVLKIKDHTADLEDELVLRRGMAFEKTSDTSISVNTLYVNYDRRAGDMQ